MKPTGAYLIRKLSDCLNLSMCLVNESKLSLTQYIMWQVCKLQFEVADQGVSWPMFAVLLLELETFYGPT